MAQAITEEQGLHEQWYEEAKKISTPEELAAFVTRLTTEYDHDYGTICHAIAASAIAAAWACDRSAQGGNQRRGKSERDDQRVHQAA